MELSFWNNNKKWRIVTVYSQDIEETLRKLKEDIREEEEEHLIIGGNWNTRTGEEGRPIEIGKIEVGEMSLVGG